MAIWQIDPSHSSVEFSVKHMMISSTKGRFSGVAGTINYDPANLEQSSVNVSIDTSTIDTRDEKRDGHLKSADFFDVENFPAITFVSKSVKSTGDDTFDVTGHLTIRGVSKEVVLKTESQGTGLSPWGTEAAGFSAATSIDRKEFGLNWNVALETGGILVGDKIKITLEVEATKQAVAAEAREAVAV